MRAAFFRTLCELAKEDERIHMITGDLGFGVVEPFAEQFPDRFLNAGIAEQNMTGLAAGLALCGNVVFTYSIANFPTLRCLEQIRNDVCYHEANVKIIAVGGGLAYGALGMSHHATEDLAIMRTLPNLKVIAPGTVTEAAEATRAIVDIDGPVYMRLGRAAERIGREQNIDFRIGKAIMMQDGEDLTIVSTGDMLAVAMRAAEMLEDRGVRARVLSMHTIKPLDREAVIRAARQTGGVFTVEEHSEIGGLGSAVAELLLESGYHCLFRRIALPDRFNQKLGSCDYLRNLHGLDAPAISGKILNSLRARPGAEMLPRAANF